MKKKLWIHEGTGHYIGSKIIVCASCLEDAESLIRNELNNHGLYDEELNIREMELVMNTVLVSDNGDY